MEQAVKEQGQEITTREPQAPAETGGMVAMIERLALSPDVDVMKLEKLLEMQERIMAQNAKAAFTAALAEMQPDLPIIGERGQSNTGSYALWEDINEAIKPVLSEHGFALSFRTGQDDEKIIVTGVLSHSEGHSEETTMHLPADTSGSKNAVQAIGSSTSYGKRYTAAALLNLTSRGEDDDGESGGAKKLTDEQIEEMTTLADDLGVDKIAFCKAHKVDSLADISQANFEAAKAAIRQKGARK